VSAGPLAAAALGAPPLPRLRLGRTFVHPGFDALVIGGGLSLLAVAWLKYSGAAPTQAELLAWLPMALLFSNSAHFAASTVRLYTKPGAFAEFPFLTMGLPLATLAVLGLVMVFAENVGPHLQALYLTWSPYHYAAQAYGLALMYAMRSGCPLEPPEKRLLRLSCLTPFVFAFFNGRGAGLDWFLPQGVQDLPWVYLSRGVVVQVLQVAIFLLPIVLLVLVRRRGRSLPLISLLIMVSNGIWWTTLVYIDAFIWATVFHGLQYLAIVTIFHVKDRQRAAGAGRGWLRPTATFYAACVALGYCLFQLWPHSFALLGFGWSESVLLVVAAINIHHFIVDAYIWRLRKEGNYSLVT